MSNVIIHKHDGTSFEIPETNLENTRRLLVGQISNVEYKDPAMNENAFAEALGIDESDELIVEVIENSDEKPVRNPTLAELEGTDKDVLKSLADKVAEKKGITKVNGRAGVKKLAEYINKNQ